METILGIVFALGLNLIVFGVMLIVASSLFLLLDKVINGKKSVRFTDRIHPISGRREKRVA